MGYVTVAGGVKEAQETFLRMRSEQTHGTAARSGGMTAEPQRATQGWQGTMDWFDPSDDVVIQPLAESQGFRRRTFGTDRIDIAPTVVFANNGHGKLFDAVCRELDLHADTVRDYRAKGYCQYRTPASDVLTVYRASEPAPYAAADLEQVISVGAKTILFLNGTGSLSPDVPVGSVVLPGELIREEGTSFHYAPPDVSLCTDLNVNEQIRGAATSLGIELKSGKHWTTDALYRETFTKVERYRRQGVLSVEMELSALAGVAYYRAVSLSALLVVTDILSRSHSWSGTATDEFRQGVADVARLAARVALRSARSSSNEA